MATASTAFYTHTNPDLDAATQEWYSSTFIDLVTKPLPLFAALFDRKRVTIAGKAMTGLMKTQTGESLIQDYTTNEGLTTGAITRLGKPYWLPKRMQLPIQYDVDEYEQVGGNGAPVELDLVKQKTTDAMEDFRIGLYRRMYGFASADAAYLTAATGEDSKKVQSIRNALIHDAPYGHLTRTGTTVNAAFQGGSILGTNADYDTAKTWSLNTVRQGITAVSRIGTTNKNDLMVIVGPTGHLALKNAVEAFHVVQRTDAPPSMTKFGFNSFWIDGVEVVEDPWLVAANNALAYKWMFILNLSTWEFAVHPKRAFLLTPFQWQAMVPNGPDAWLARIMLTANLFCRQPAKNLYLSNVA